MVSGISFQFHQALAALDRLAFFDSDRFHRAGPRRINADFHFHRFQDGQRLAAGHLLAGADQHTAHHAWQLRCERGVSSRVPGARAPGFGFGHA